MRAKQSKHLVRRFVIGCMASIACAQDDDGRGLGGGGVVDGQCVTPSGEACEVPVCDDPCAHNDPGFGQECVVPEPGVCDDVRGVQVTFQQVGGTVAAPGGFFKTNDAALQKWVEARWQEMADFVVPQATMTKLTAGGVKVWNYPDGWGWTRTDFHAGLLALPAGTKPEQLLRALVDDPEAATGNNELSGWVGWPAVASGQRKIGDRVDLDIWGGDAGAVGYWKIDADRFCVITLQNATAGTHPVSGIRCWGFVPIAINPNWLKLPDNQKYWGCAGPTYMFYTMGIDSPNVAGSGGVGSELQAGTWNSLVRDLLRENDRAGGHSGRWFVQKTVAQPNSLAPGSGVAVTAPGEFESYYVTLPRDSQRDGEFCDNPALPAGSCAEGQFTCADGQCIDGAQRCDGTGDCADRDDEQACDGDEADACPGQFACDDAKCIPDEWRCDGEYEDCASGEDELGCESDDVACAGDDFACTDGSCIPAAWKCDAIDDCADAIDEAGCGDTAGEPGGDEPSADCDGFACDDGQCISAAWVCDDIVDCAGSEDEWDCPAPPADDPPADEGCDGFVCDDDTCIPASWECDGYEDCAQAEDEWCG